jgi:hypothetical protein
MYYVYKHIRLKDGSIFYIGKGKGLRFESEKGRNEYWNRIVRKDGGFTAEIVKENLTNEEACDLEKKLISEIGLNSLSNIAEGGTGGDTRKGFTQEEYDEWIRNKSEAQKGKTSWWKGKVREEHSKKLKEIAAKTGCYKNNGKAIKTDDWKLNQSIAASKRIRKKVVCNKCGIEIVDTHLKVHQMGKNCKH